MCLLFLGTDSSAVNSSGCYVITAEWVAPKPGQETMRHMRLQEVRLNFLRASGKWWHCVSGSFFGGATAGSPGGPFAHKAVARYCPKLWAPKGSCFPKNNHWLTTSALSARFVWLWGESFFGPCVWCCTRSTQKRLIPLARAAVPEERKSPPNISWLIKRASVD